MIKISEKGDELTLTTHDGKEIVYTVDMWPHEEGGKQAKVVVGEIQNCIMRCDERDVADADSDGLIKAWNNFGEAHRE